MSYALNIQSEAIIDIQTAFEWYELQKNGLGFEFIEEVEKGFTKICNHPQYYTFVTAYLRRFKIGRFPYLIIYETENEVVIVNSVKHARQKRKL